MGNAESYQEDTLVGTRHGRKGDPVDTISDANYDAFSNLRRFYAGLSLFFFVNLVVLVVLSIIHWDRFYVQTYFVSFDYGDKTDAQVNGVARFNLSVLAILFFTWSSLCFAYMSCAWNRGALLRAVVDDSANLVRWVAYLGAAPQMVMVAILCGIKDTSSLVLIAVSIIVLMFFGVVTEELRGRDIICVMQYGGWMLYMAPWAVIIASYSHHASDAPWFVHVIFATQVFFISLFGPISYWHTTGLRGSLPRRLTVEWMYAIPDVLSKTLIAWFLVGGAMSR